MEQRTRITVPLSVDEFDALTQSARSDYRHPRDQARHILRQVLMGSSTGPPTKNEGRTVVIEAAGTPFGIQS